MKIISFCLIIVLSGLLAAISICCPNVINSNQFLSHFLNHEILSIQAVIVTVTLVSITQVHVELSKVERRLGARIFCKARMDINRTTAFLVGSLLVMLAFLAFIGGVNTQTSPSTASFLKSGCLLLLVAGTLAMADIIRISFVLSAEDMDEASTENSSEEKKGEDS